MRETHKLVGLVSERTQSAIKKVMLEWGEKVLEQIEACCMDMTGNYKSLVSQLCPNADVTIDRFHVTKMVHEELNQARIDNHESSGIASSWLVVRMCERECVPEAIALFVVSTGQ